MCSSRTRPVGSINQTARGGFSFLTNSSSEEAPTAPSFSSAFTFSSERLNTTTSCLAFNHRRAMFMPIRPRPINPICIRFSGALLFFVLVVGARVHPFFKRLERPPKAFGQLGQPLGAEQNQHDDQND